MSVPSPSVFGMDLAWIEELDGQGAADALAASHAARIEAEAAEFVLAAHWADLHNPETITSRRDGHGRVLPGTERARAYGADGTPLVAEFAAAELGCLLARSPLSAANLLRDALDVRHRHPRHWALLRAGQIAPWQAIEIARRTREAGLTLAQAHAVDARLDGYLGVLPWARFLRLVDAAVIAADPAGAEARRRLAEADQYVTVGQANEHGLKTMIVKANAGDVIYFTAMCNRIAAILATHGDTDPIGVRRAKAIGILANPARALTLLQQAAAAASTGNNPDTTGTDTAGADTTSDTEDSTSRSGEDSGNRSDQHGAESGVGEQHGADPAPSGEAAAPNGLGLDEVDEPILGTEPEHDSSADLGTGADARTASGTNADADAGARDTGAAPGPAATNTGSAEPDTTDPPNPAALTGSAGPPDPHPDPDTGPDPGSDPGTGPDSSTTSGPETIGEHDLPVWDNDADDPPPPHYPCPTCAGAGRLTGDPATQPAPLRIDPKKLLPPATLYVHMSLADYLAHTGGVARVENQHVGPVTIEAATSLLRHSHVTVKPVIDLTNQMPVDAYETPAAMREVIHLLRPASMFPYDPTTSRRLDLDHPVPYRKPEDGGPPGQTDPYRMCPLTRYTHRVKTHATGWRHYNPLPGVYLWRTRHGHWYRTDRRGTHPLGKNPDLQAHGLTPEEHPGDLAPDITGNTTAARPTPPRPSLPEERFAALITG